MEENEQLGNTEQLNADEVTSDEFQAALEEAMKKQFEKVRMAGLLAGSKGICGVIVQYINQFNNLPGKRTLNDYRRLVKKINDFCSVSLSKKIDEQTGEIVGIEPDDELVE
jgi:hypothetical protein